jgi:hypothetical protein
VDHSIPDRCSGRRHRRRSANLLTIMSHVDSFVPKFLLTSRQFLYRRLETGSFQETSGADCRPQTVFPIPLGESVEEWKLETVCKGSFHFPSDSVPLPSAPLIGLIGSSVFLISIRFPEPGAHTAAKGLELLWRTFIHAPAPKLLETKERGFSKFCSHVAACRFHFRTPRIAPGEAETRPEGHPSHLCARVGLPARAS